MNSFFNVGNALESLNNAKNAKAEQEFNEKIEDIQDTANEQATLYGDIEKGSGTLLGGIVGTKAVIGSIKKMKDAISKFKNRNKEDGNNEDEDNGADEEGIEGLGDEATEGLEGVTDSITDTAADLTSQLGNTMDGVVNSGRDMMNNFTSGGEPGYTETPLESTTTTSEFGQEMPSTEPSGTGGGDVEMTNMGDDAIADLEGDGADAVSSAGESSNAASGAAETATEAGAEGGAEASEVGAETAGEVGGEVAGEVGLEAGAEVAGAALDATGIGAIIGIPLQILGLVGAGAGVVAGIIGTDSAETTETTSTQAAQAAEKAAEATPADVAGRFAPQQASAIQRLTGMTS